MVETCQQLIGGEFVDSAATAAAKAFETWRETTPQDRSLILLKFADALEARAEDVGTLESRDAGKLGPPRATGSPRTRPAGPGKAASAGRSPSAVS